MPVGIKTASGRVREVMERGLHQGMVQLSPISATWNIAGRCTCPVTIGLHGRGHRSILESHAEPSGRYLDMEVQCRNCPTCLRKRAWLWTTRAKAELDASARTWFGTMTLNPESHYTMLCRALAKAREDGVDAADLTDAEIFALRTSEAGAEITKYLKRIRKESEAKLRYLTVAERHKSGLPHFHMLLHEVSPVAPVRERCLSSQWSLGFTKWRLVPQDEKRHAYYVCKYLSKSKEARVRASLRYGSGWSISPDKLSQQIVPEKPERENIAPAQQHEAPYPHGTGAMIGKKV